jgi:hypothetical protein
MVIAGLRLTRGEGLRKHKKPPGPLGADPELTATKDVVLERPFAKKRDVVHKKTKMYLINTAGIQG